MYNRLFLFFAISVSILCICHTVSGDALLQIDGVVTQGGNPVGAGFVVAITNQDNALTVEVATQADGTYMGAIFSIPDAALPGHTIETVIRSQDGTTELGSNTEIHAGGDAIVVDVMLVPQATVALDSGGPPMWTYTLTHVSGIITSWTYTGAGITNATVTGDAAANGWVVDNLTGTEVTYTNAIELTGPVSGFEIEGNDGGTGTWSAGDSAGNIDGSLPVELAQFGGTFTDEGVRLRWRTASEVSNLGFNLYRSETPTGKFEKINAALIRGAGTSATIHDYQFVDEDTKGNQVYYYYVEDIDFGGVTGKSSIIKVDPNAPSDPFVVNGRSLAVNLGPPLKTHLLQNYPNPFNPETWVPYHLAQSADVRLTIYDINGTLIRTIPVGLKPAGIYQSKNLAVYWNGRNESGETVANGIYFYRLTAGEYSAIRKMLIQK